MTNDLETPQPPYNEHDLNWMRKNVFDDLWKRLLNSCGWVERTWRRKGKNAGIEIQ